MIGRLVSLTLVLAVTACGYQPPLPSPAPSPSPAACPAGGLAFSAAGGDAAMGLRVLVLRMDNCGTEPYAVEGYPDLKLLDEDGRVLDVRVLRGSKEISTVESFEVPPTPVTLQPGDAATTGLVWRNTYDDTTNPPQVGVRIDIAPLAGRPRQTFTPHLGPDGAPGGAESNPVTIDLGSTGKLGVSPWTKS
ncbi:hypothetical protein FHS29_003663 [Saccharothrix tamanrassetensis]|uniref:DUF4232 domain-containing protein n=1 Tax=Saccharothrix tamanrassetensis TaxID=1051531 RepID=A0A841CJ42_9PSEU|nr:DUF4232 domain-containing protein [Saccharothrix tamanrassetensis]MBB5957070.1 hypothetical protein [Saccharothrix tamanrassetensis]